MREVIDNLDLAYRRTSKARRLLIVAGFIAVFAVGFLAGSIYQYHAIERVIVIHNGPSIET